MAPIYNNNIIKAKNSILNKNKIKHPLSIIQIKPNIEYNGVLEKITVAAKKKVKHTKNLNIVIGVNTLINLKSTTQKALTLVQKKFRVLYILITTATNLITTLVVNGFNRNHPVGAGRSHSPPDPVC